jgi:hypothetical protein
VLEPNLTPPSLRASRRVTGDGYPTVVARVGTRSQPVRRSVMASLQLGGRYLFRTLQAQHCFSAAASNLVSNVKKEQQRDNASQYPCNQKETFAEGATQSAVMESRHVK